MFIDPIKDWNIVGMVIYYNNIIYQSINSNAYINIILSKKYDKTQTKVRVKIDLQLVHFRFSDVNLFAPAS